MQRPCAGELDFGRHQRPGGGDADQRWLALCGSAWGKSYGVSDTGAVQKCASRNTRPPQIGAFYRFFFWTPLTNFFGWEGSPTEIDKKDLTSLMEHLENVTQPGLTDWRLVHAAAV